MNNQIHQIVFSQAFNTICQPYVSLDVGTSQYWGGLDFGTKNVSLTGFDISLWNEHQRTTTGSSMYWIAIGS